MMKNKTLWGFCTLLLLGACSENSKNSEPKAPDNTAPRNEYRVHASPDAMPPQRPWEERGERPPLPPDGDRPPRHWEGRDERPPMRGEMPTPPPRRMMDARAPEGHAMPKEFEVKGRFVCQLVAETSKKEKGSKKKGNKKQKSKRKNA